MLHRFFPDKDRPPTPEPATTTLEFESALELASNNLHRFFLSLQHTKATTTRTTTTKSENATELARVLVDDAALTLVVALCGIPPYSKLVGQSKLCSLLCKALGVLMDHPTVGMATQARTNPQLSIHSTVL